MVSIYVIHVLYEIQTINLFKMDLTLYFCHHYSIDLAGYLIPKGWKVLTWFRDLHMDPEVYPDPRKFDPSRWDVSLKILFCIVIIQRMFVVTSFHLCFIEGLRTKGWCVPSFWCRKPSMPRK